MDSTAIGDKAERKNAYFFWDYDLTEEDVRAILSGNDEDRKIWVIGRIVQYALFDDIWKFIKLTDLEKYYDRLSWRTPYFKELWGYALGVWRNVN